jgi:hypothetical protein
MCPLEKVFSLLQYHHRRLDTSIHSVSALSASLLRRYFYSPSLPLNTNIVLTATMLGYVFVCLKGLLAKCNRRHDDKSLTFLRLPVDVICLILQELPLSAKVLLSQTCRSMRALLQDSRALIQSLSQRDYFNFLSELADSLPNYVTCSLHCKLHIVNTTDLPYPPFASKRYPCSQGWTDVPCHSYGIQYRLSYWHVQLVLKHSRRQLSHQFIQENYFSDLLRPFTEHALLFNRVAIDYNAQPKVIGGRFILHSQWEYWIQAQSVVMEDIGPSKLCPHLNLTRPLSSLVRPNPLIASVTYAFDNLGEETYGSCARCATDYLILALPSGVAIKVWQDLGNSGSPWDPYWVALMDSYDNCQFWGPSIPHQPQSVMESWKQSETSTRIGY